MSPDSKLHCYFILCLSNLLKYILGMINCIYLKYTMKWALTDAHTHETTNTLKKQNICMNFKPFLVLLCSQFLSLPSTQPTPDLFSVNSYLWKWNYEVRTLMSGFTHSAQWFLRFVHVIACTSNFFILIVLFF